MTAPNNRERILPRLIHEEIKESFINYSMSVIVSRALPDVRDGLKPVHRRVLYAMNELGLVPGRPYKKSATVVGDVLGKYHPHGDQSVYDALVRMVQDFSLRYPLVDGQGNFGSVDGDPAAAYRYTESRLTRIAVEMLADIDKNTVDFAPNFDDRLLEPKIDAILAGAAGLAADFVNAGASGVVAATSATAKDGPWARSANPPMPRPAVAPPNTRILAWGHDHPSEPNIDVACRDSTGAFYIGTTANGASPDDRIAADNVNSSTSNPTAATAGWLPMSGIIIDKHNVFIMRPSAALGSEQNAGNKFNWDGLDPTDPTRTPRRCGWPKRVVQ